MSADNVYLLHLPKDVVSSIPTIIQNSGLGASPNYLDPLNVIADIVDMVFNFLVYVITSTLLLLQQLADVGLATLGDLSSAVASAVQTAVDKIVDTFTAFVEWVSDLIEYLFESLIKPSLDYLSGLIGGIYQRIKSASESIESDIANFGSATASSLAEMTNAIFCDTFTWIIILSTAINYLIFAIKVGTIGSAFVVSTGMSILAGLIITNLVGAAVGSYDLDSPTNSTEGAITDWIESVFLNSGQSPTTVDEVVGYIDTSWCVLEIIPAMIICENIPNVETGIALASSLFSIIVGCYAIADHDARLSAVGFVFGLFGAIESIASLRESSLSGELKILVATISIISIGLISVDLACTVL